jgi:hypothetical protein
VKTAAGCIVVGIMGETTQMSGWIRPQLFWTVLSHSHRLPYTYVRMVSYQATRCEHFMVR